MEMVYIMVLHTMLYLGKDIDFQRVPRVYLKEADCNSDAIILRIEQGLDNKSLTCDSRPIVRKALGK